MASLKDFPLDISRDEYAKWPSPRRALAAVCGVDPAGTVGLIERRLKSGRLRAVAQTITQIEDGVPIDEASFVSIPPQWWGIAEDISAPESTFWRASISDLTITLGSGIDGRKYELSGIRFEPNEVLELQEQLPPDGPFVNPMEQVAAAIRGVNGIASGGWKPSTSARPPPPRPLIQAQAAEASSDLQHNATPPAADPGYAHAEKPPQRKPVSPATLKAWWDLCKTMQPSEQWRFEEMEAFFDRCFPDKFVSRERLREIRGAQKSGPKPRAAE